MRSKGLPSQKDSGLADVGRDRAVPRAPRRVQVVANPPHALVRRCRPPPTLRKIGRALEQVAGLAARAAQASSTRMPGRASSSGAASCAPASCTETRPSLKPGSADTATGARDCTAAGAQATRVAQRCPRRRAPRGSPRRASATDPRAGPSADARCSPRACDSKCSGQAARSASTSHCGMRGARGELASTRASRRRPLRHEAPQHGIDESRGALLPQDARRIDRRVRTWSAARIARVLDLVSGGDEQRADLRRDAFGPRQQAFERGCEPQIPAHACRA